MPPPAASTRSAGRPAAAPHLRPAEWAQLPGWDDDNLVEAWPAWLQSCKAIGREPAWQQVCGLSERVDGHDRDAIRDFFQRNFQPHEVVNPDNSPWGLVTGYYAPVIRGDRTRTERARYPIYGLPADLISVELSAVYPELKFKRLRGRLVGNRLVPYFTREEIVNGTGGFRGTAIAWAEDPVELYYLQIEGSGRVEFPDGKQLRIGYAGQNGHPFRSVAGILMERGELGVSEASLQGIKRWGERNPDKLAYLLNLNPSYVFFRELPDDLPAPVGSLSVPLTSERSAAVDPCFIPLGSPLFLSTTRPLSNEPLNRLLLAQDTGGAIKGAVRVDFFWGCGEEAGKQAVKMKQTGRKWVLLPRDYFPENSSHKE
jgi:membrane-bound lytic murein transglycosylase A